MVRILVADDHPQVRAAIRMCLQMHANWNVCGEAANGREAVETALKLQPDIVLLDYAMPQMNGLEAARLIASSAPKARVVLFTMFAAEQLVSLAYAAGVADVVSKDVGGMQQLVKSIKNLTSDAA